MHAIRNHLSATCPLADPTMRFLLVLLVVVVIALHQDFWNWTDRSLVFGFLPIGLAYHVGFSCLAAATMWVLVKFAWPAEAEESFQDPASAQAATGEDAA